MLGFAVLAESVDTASCVCSGRDLPQVFGSVEPSSFGGGGDRPVFLCFVRTDSVGVVRAGTGDGDAVVEACGLVAFSAFQFLLR